MVELSKKEVFKYWFSGGRKWFTIVHTLFSLLMPIGVWQSERQEPFGDMNVVLIASIFTSTCWIVLVVGLIVSWKNYWTWVQKHPKTWNQRI